MLFDRVRNIAASYSAIKEIFEPSIEQKQAATAAKAQNSDDYDGHETSSEEEETEEASGSKGGAPGGESSGAADDSLRARIVRAVAGAGTPDEARAAFSAAIDWADDEEASGVLAAAAASGLLPDSVPPDVRSAIASEAEDRLQFG